MRPSVVFPPSRITQMGEIARACITPGQHGKVLAVFSKAIYLLTDTNELFWITTGDIPMHRRGATISTPPQGPSAGSPFHVEGHRLMIDPAFVFDIKDAPLWRAPCVDTNHALEMARLPARIHSFFSSLDFSHVRGFGTFILPILSLSRNGYLGPSPQSGDSVLSFAQPIVFEIANACLEHQSSQIFQSADALIGLGTGLTPSGDDFLGGMLFAITILQDAYPDSHFSDYKIPLESYGLRTHLISFTLLNDLSGGHAIEPLHQITNGLLHGELLESIYPSATKLIQVGHSTGWDLLTGLLVGLLTVYQGNYSIPSFQMSHTLEA